MDKQNHEMRKLKVHDFLKPDITKELNPLFSDLQTEPYLETMEFLHRNNILPRNNRNSDKKNRLKITECPISGIETYSRFLVGSCE